MLSQCSRCHLEIPKDFPENDGRLCPTCYKKVEGDCMRCGASPVEIVEFHRVYGLVALGFTGRRILVLCADCTRRVVLKNLLYTAFFGWLGITPFYKSLVGQRVNLRSLFKHPSLPPATKPLIALVAYIVPLAAVLVLAGLLLFGVPGNADQGPFDPLPEKAVTLREEADAELSAGHPDRAEHLYRQALVHAPKNPHLRLGLGRALERQEKFKDAEEQYRRCLVPFNEKSFLDGRRSLGLFLLRTGRASKAVEVLEKEMELCTDSPREVLALHRTFQDAMRRAGRGRELPGIYRKLLAKWPDDPAPPYLMGRLEAGKNPGLAVEWFQQAIEEDKTNRFFDPVYALGRVHLQTGAWDEAREAFEKALEIRKGSRQVLFSLGEALYHGGRPKLAGERFRELAGLHKNSPLGPLGSGRLALWQGNAETSIPHFDAAFALVSEGYYRAEALRGKGKALALQGKLEEAKSLFKQTMETSIEQDQLALASFWSAEASVRLAGEDAQALWKAAADGAENAWTVKVAVFFLGKTDRETLLSAFEEKGLEAWAPFASYFAGLRLRQQGKGELAKAHFESASALGPGYLEALVHTLRGK